MENFYMIGGKKFSQSQYRFLMAHFKEAFSHTSVSIESAFNELRMVELSINSKLSNDSIPAFSSLIKQKKTMIMNTLNQMIVYHASRNALVIEEEINGQMVNTSIKMPDINDIDEINKLSRRILSYINISYKHILQTLVFDENGAFDSRSTFANLSEFINLSLRRKLLFKIASGMKKDNLDAFDYAMGLKEMTILDIIKINEIVVNSDLDKVVGFKKTNNDILSASFTPSDKTTIPTEMQRLMAEYKNNFGRKILDPFEPNIPYEEKNRRIDEIFLREAEFHIRFERLHPFNDGNGRTGRIILNYNLIHNHIAPVLITDDMSSDYKEYINTLNIEGLAKLLKFSSSQQLTNWISLSSNSKGLFDNTKLARLAEFEEKNVRKI